MERSEKEAEVAFLTDSFSSSQIALCADYRGLTVTEITALRNDLRSVGSVGRVVKNTLAKISLEKSFSDADSGQVQKFSELMTGPSFLVFSKEDPVAPAKILAKFAKEHEQLDLKGGWFEGAFLDEEAVKALSRLPSREEILGKLLSLMNAPATQLMQLLQAPSRQMVQVLEAQRAKLEKAG